MQGDSKLFVIKMDEQPFPEKNNALIHQTIKYDTHVHNAC